MKGNTKRWLWRSLALLFLLACPACSLVADEFSFLDGAAAHATGDRVGVPDPADGQR